MNLRFRSMARRLSGRIESDDPAGKFRNARSFERRWNIHEERLFSGKARDVDRDVGSGDIGLLQVSYRMIGPKISLRCGVVVCVVVKCS